MCRLIASIGEFSSSVLLESFVSMAKGQKAIHGHNPSLGDFQHRDGWGAVYYEDGQWQSYVSDIPCWKDNVLDYLADRKLVLLHARRASNGTVYLENTQPYRRRVADCDWFYCHNGTVFENIPLSDNLEDKERDQIPSPIGTSDSERLFVYLLSNLHQQDNLTSIGNAIDRLTHYTSVNSLLFDGQDLHVVSQYDANSDSPGYYTMYAHRDQNGIVISSEKLIQFSHR